MVRILKNQRGSMLVFLRAIVILFSTIVAYILFYEIVDSELRTWAINAGADATTIGYLFTAVDTVPILIVVGVVIMVLAHAGRQEVFEYGYR